MTPADALALARSRRATVPSAFVPFCTWLGVDLTPGQRELARVAFDGGEPGDGLGARLFGFQGPVPVGARGVVAAVCGARAGKSYVLVALRLVFGMLVRDLSSMAPGQKAVALIIAPNDKLRREVLAYALGAVQKKPELAGMLCDEAADGFGLRRPDGHTVRFETGVAARGGYGARGRSLTDFSLDESAFFRDASFKINDQEVFRAGSARVLPGGQTIVASTPWAQAGLLYELHRDNFGKPTRALVAHAPTLVLHDSPMTRGIVERERERDPDNAAREFDAQFMTAGTTVFFEASSIESAVTDEPFALEPGDMVAAGADMGLRADSSALALVAMRGGTLHLFDGLEKRPEEGKPLKPGVTSKEFAERIKGRCGYLMTDHHFRDAVAEHLEAFNLGVVPSPGKPADVYVRARALLREGKVKIHRATLDPEYVQRLLQQLREVHGKPSSGGGMSIVHPRWATGGHGDIADAFTLALWQAAGDTVAAPMTPEAQRIAEKRARHEQYQAEQDRPHWRTRGQATDRGRNAFWRR